MDIKDIKYLFRNYERYTQLIENQKEKLAMLRAQAEKITPSYSENSGGGGKNNKSKVEENVIKMHEIESNIQKLEMFINTADDMLKKLKSHQRKLITLVYINNNSYEYAAMVEDTTPENIRKIVNSAFKVLEKY